MNNKTIPAVKISANQGYWALFGLFVLNKLIVFLLFSTQYVDHDQVTMWLAAEEMLSGKLHEPCFWGQSYNSMFEALCAVPLLYLGIPHFISVGMVTAFMASFPFLFGSRVLYKNGYKRLGLFLLIVPLILNVDYDIIVGMSRGWVTGLFVASFSFWSWAHPHRKAGWILFGFTGAFALWLNPNSIFLLLIIGYGLIPKNYRSIKFYLLTAAGSIIPIAWAVFARSFYLNNPDYEFHGFPELVMSLSQLLENISMLDKFFRYLAPLTYALGWVSLLLFPVIIGLLFFKRKRLEAILFLILFFGIIALLSINKSGDSHYTIFFSGARFFLAYPIMLTFLIVSIMPSESKKLHLKTLIALAVLMVILNTSVLLTKYGTIEKTGKLHWVSVDYIPNMQKKCNELMEIADQNNVSVVVFRDDADQLLAYGCPCLVDDFPLTLFPWYERRTWRLKEERNRVHRNLLLVRPDKPNSSGKGLDISSGVDKGEYIIISDNRIQTIQLLKENGYRVR